MAKKKKQQGFENLDMNMLSSVVAVLLVVIAFAAMFNTVGGLISIFEGLTISLMSVGIIILLAVYAKMEDATK